MTDDETGATGAATLIDAVAAALRKAGAYNRDDQARPVAVLWPDRERQWEPLLPRLRGVLPILTLGAFDAEAGTGPAYWLRYALTDPAVVRLDVEGAGVAPILYLPGVSKAELRAVEECPKPLQPIAELQYRGVIWTHRNGRDWTVPAFLQAADGGLGIEIGTDSATREAMLQGLTRLADLSVRRLRREAPLRAAFFHALLNPDEARSLLEWLDDPAGFRRAASPEVWGAFATVAGRGYGFDPDRDGEVTAAQLLGRREGRWETVWERFREAPGKYPNLEGLLRRAKPGDKAQLSLFGGGTASESWPQDNDAEEDRLRADLLGLVGRAAGEARAAIAALETEHGRRRSWVWAELGRAPLATALEQLTSLASETERAPGGADVAAVAGAYAEWGWRADAAALGALRAVEASADVKAVGAAVVAVYRPWVETAAAAMQAAVAASSALPRSVRDLPPVDAGTCLLFADGLRYDAAQGLTDLLGRDGHACALDWRTGALPGVTPTAKPATTPVAGLIGPGSGLDTVVAATGAKVTAETLRKQMAGAGWQVLRNDDVGDPSGRAWTEIGAIDGYGHQHGWKLAHHLTGELHAIRRRISDLLAEGWQSVTVVTDHGWLLMPGGLPKAELPEHLTEVRKGRCARLKAGAVTSEQTVPWAWDPEVRIAVARGIACYEAGKEYDHGGISPQECVVPVLSVSATTPTANAAIERVTWRGLRCAVMVWGGQSGYAVDIRTKAGDAGTSIVATTKAPSADGSVSLVVEDDDLEGNAAHVVLLDGDGRVLTQRVTTVGG